MSPMEQSSSGVGYLSTTMTTTIMVVAVIVVFLLFIFALFLYLHAKKYWGANPAFSNGRRERFVFPAEQTVENVRRRGLDSADIKELSLFVFKPENFTEGLECAVCLSELVKGEEARLLPLCRHAFHVECIDMWFQSHSNCPLCRSAVLVSDSTKNATESSAEVTEVHHVTEVNSLESAENLSTEVREVSSVVPAMPEGSSNSSVSSPLAKNSGMLVIEIPRKVINRFVSSVSPLPLSSNPAEEVRSPTMLRLQSLRRILRAVGSPRSPRSTSVVDIEQGMNSNPKTPTGS